MIKATNKEDDKYVTGDKIRAILIEMVDVFLDAPFKKIYVGENGIRIEVEGMPVLLMMLRKQTYFWGLWSKTKYEMLHGNMYSEIEHSTFQELLNKTKKWIDSNKDKKQNF